MNPPRISFGIIVLNGEPFVRYCLRSIYPFAHQIIVVEGAAPAARAVATADGHSRDGTLDTLRAFQLNEDPDHKLILVTAEDDGYADGFWPGEKHEQSQAYARRATGDFLWQVDVDEFYHAADTARIIAVLRDDPAVTAVKVRQVSFWGGFDYIVDGWYLRQGARDCRRVFKWRPGYRYVTHRPPTIRDRAGRDVCEVQCVDAAALARAGVCMYHLSLVFPRQVQEKCAYYTAAPWARKESQAAWDQDSFAQLNHPFRVHNVAGYPSWLERFSGKLPEQVQALRDDIAAGRCTDAPVLRSTDDIERLLRSPVYRLGRTALKIWAPLSRRRREPASAWLARLGRQAFQAGGPHRTVHIPAGT